MTLKEFSEKYDVPYHIVYESSYKVSPVSTMQHDREYVEKEVFAAVKEVLSKRIRYHRDLMERGTAILGRMVEGR